MASVTSVPDIFNQAEFLVGRHIEEGRAANTAIYYEDRKITYAELAARVNRTSRTSRAIGPWTENI